MLGKSDRTAVQLTGGALSIDLSAGFGRPCSLVSGNGFARLLPVAITGHLPGMLANA